jgi:L-alanine-DL-glutamate epimerase-like enolase superfamily enzyme
MLIRRDFLKALPLLAAAVPSFSMRSFAASALRTKITDIRIVKVRAAEHLGTYTNTFRTPQVPTSVDVGGFSITEVYTDQGAIGIGPGSSPEAVALAKARLVGKDPFDVEDHARYLNVLGRPGVQIEIAIWDLCGKLANQPLAKMWGGGMDRIMPYGATFGIGEGPEERGHAAAQVKADGFKAVKMRASFPTMKEDILMMTLARKAIGDDTTLLVDANKAGPYGNAQMVTLWDYQRAYQTALEFQKLNTYWLEEPLGRFDYDGLAELNRNLTMRLAGGEVNTKLDEYRTYLEKGCYDVLNLDVGVLGPTLYRQAMDLAFAFNRRVVPHASGILVTICHMHLAASHPQPTYGYLDEAPHFELDHNPPIMDFRKMWSVLTNAPQLEKDGYMKVPTDPGLGVTIRPDLIERS